MSRLQEKLEGLSHGWWKIHLQSTKTHKDIQKTNINENNGYFFFYYNICLVELKSSIGRSSNAAPCFLLQSLPGAVHSLRCWTPSRAVSAFSSIILSYRSLSCLFQWCCLLLLLSMICTCTQRYNLLYKALTRWCAVLKCSYTVTQSQI